MGKVIGYIPEPVKKSQKSEDTKAEQLAEQIEEGSPLETIQQALETVMPEKTKTKQSKS